MARCMRFDDQDRAALRALDDFAISRDGEIATVAGDMKVELVRPADDGGGRLGGRPLPQGRLGAGAVRRHCPLRAHRPEAERASGLAGLPQFLGKSGRTR